MNEYSRVHVAPLRTFQSGASSEKITYDIRLLELIENYDDWPASFCKQVNQIVGNRNDSFLICRANRQSPAIRKKVNLKIHEQQGSHFFVFRHFKVVPLTRIFLLHVLKLVTPAT